MYIDVGCVRIQEASTQMVYIKVATFPNPQEMTEMANTIAAPYRFAKRKGDEYHVFSLFVETPHEVDNWMGVKTQHNVLIDPDTFEELKNNRLEWVFDDNNVIVACKKLQGVIADKKKEMD